MNTKKYYLLGVFFLCYFLTILESKASDFCGDKPSHWIDVSVKDYQKVLSNLKPGEGLRLRAGYYSKGLYINHKGNHNACIWIQGDSSGATVIASSRQHHAINIENSRYVVLKHLTLEGNNVGGGNAIKASRYQGNAVPVHHVIVSDIVIQNYANVPAISTKTPAWQWIVRRTTIDTAGTGMYFGDSDGRQPFVASLIEYNNIRNTQGYNIQIKHQNNREGIARQFIEQPTIIRYNRLVKQKIDNEWSRPNLLIGHGPVTGLGENSDTIIYANDMYRTADALPQSTFQGEGNLVLWGNRMVNQSNGDAIRIAPHNARPRNVIVGYNWLAARRRGIVLQGVAEHAFLPKILANVIFEAFRSHVDDDNNVVQRWFDQKNKLWRQSMRVNPLADLPQLADIFSQYPMLEQVTAYHFCREPHLPEMRCDD